MLDLVDVVVTTFAHGDIFSSIFDDVWINVGGWPYTDSVGRTWFADTHCEDGVIYSTCPAAIANTVEDELYCSMRFFPSLNVSPLVYNIPVYRIAQYEVRLHFAETVSRVCPMTAKRPQPDSNF